MALLGKKKTPREEAEDITAGRSKPHHIGPKSKEVLLQEWFSLWNTKPAFQKEGHKWKMQQLEKELQSKYGIKDPMAAWRGIYKKNKT